jgi:DNA-directed RNA polymerase subunit RPC12/RpoP
MENTLIRSQKCPECGADMLWTQNAWPPADKVEAAYRCPNGHVVDPDETRQCPNCGVHDTQRLTHGDRPARFRCFRCGCEFDFPRAPGSAAQGAA